MKREDWVSTFVTHFLINGVDDRAVCLLAERSADDQATSFGPDASKWSDATAAAERELMLWN